MKKSIKIGNIYIGGDAPVTVQTMLSVPWHDTQGNILQAKEVEDAGCEILRVAVPNMDAVPLVAALKEAVDIPVVADIHFDYRIALEAVYAGADKIRINPGNIGGDENVGKVAQLCSSKGVPIRIGVNSGSVEKSILEKYGSPVPEALCESALYHARLLEQFDFTDIVISIKSSDVDTTIKAYELISDQCSYPLHLGVTEAGTEHMGAIKSAIGIGSLLQRGIGNTIRASLTASPAREVQLGIDILRALNMRSGVRFVSCPTCGRTQINLMKIANDAEDALKGCKKDITVAVMGCVVNGPGEAKEADIGIAGGKDCGILFKKGEIIKKLPEDKLLSALLEEVDRL